MCLAHIPLLEHYPHPLVGLDTPQSLVGPWLRDVLARITVPVLTVISGFLAWRSACSRSYVKLVAEKVRRILLPFLLWNLIALGLVFLMFRLFGLDFADHLARIQSPGDFLRVVVAHNAMPVNLPTYFLRDLFLILLCVPIFSLLTRRLWLGLLVAMVLSGLMLTVLPLFISLGGNVILYRNDMPLFFLLGFIIARHGNGLPSPSSLVSVVVCVGLLMASLGIAVALGQLKPPVELYLRLRPLLGLLALAALPFAISLIVAGRERWPVLALQRLSPYSYSIFLSHFLIAMVITANLPDPISRWLQTLQVDNWAPWWVQLGYISAYLLLCIGLGWVVKTVYDRLVNRLRPAGH